MKFAKKLLILFLFANVLTYAQSAKFPQSYELSGRTETNKDGRPVLIGPASSISFWFSGNRCAIALNSGTSEYNYIALELDGVYIGRFRIEKIAKPIIVPVTAKRPIHHLAIYKATEANIGDIIFESTTAKIIATPDSKKRKKIEFIGDSLMCGEGNDMTEIPCGKGNWFDQHNAYWSYASIAGRELDVDFILNSYSGIGMYRNWNTESDAKQSMPDIYESLYFNKDMSKPYDFSFKPDIISIGLGNNDYYDGNGNPARKPFEPQKFVSAYIGFLKMLYEHNPNAEIVLVSAILEGENAKTMDGCLDQIKSAFKGKKIVTFKFKDLKLHGCVSHPSKADAEIMAAQYVDFMKNQSGLKL